MNAPNYREISEEYAREAEWPEPEVIQSALPPVEPLSEELLPAAFLPLVQDIAERMQVPLDYPAAVMILRLAGAVNRRAVIQPKASDTGWVVVPNLWGGIIAPPGFMKSPVIQNVIRPLTQIQTEWRLEHEQALKDHVWIRKSMTFDLRAGGRALRPAARPGRKNLIGPMGRPNRRRCAGSLSTMPRLKLFIKR
jgi:hypothetical protein